LKKIIAIFLLLQVISNNAFAEELVKLPGLFTHYYHHAQEHKDSPSFLWYLHTHYSDHHQKDAHVQKHQDEDNDCNLPFKHCGNCCMNAHVPAVGFIAPYLSTEYTFVVLKSSSYIHENDRIESLDIGNIWQPPKIS